MPENVDEYVSVKIKKDKLYNFVHSFNYYSGHARTDISYQGFFFGRQTQELVRQFEEILKPKEAKKP